MIRRWTLATALAGILLAVCPDPSDAQTADRCPVPSDAVVAVEQLPYLAKALRTGKPVRLLVVGTASSGGAGVSAAAKAYPAVLLEALKRRFPDGAFGLSVSSRRGMTAAQMTGTFDKLIAAEMPTLTIWQTGTVDAVHGASVEDFDAALTEGIANFHAHGADVVLMNMQYSPQSAAMIDYDPYLAEMEQAAQSEEVNLFRRFEVMQHWVDTGILAIPDRPSRTDRSIADFVHGCLGELLADLIASAIDATH